MLHISFNSAQNHQIDLQLLEELPNKEITIWVLFSSNELRSIIEKYNNTSTSRPNKLSWKHFKRITRDNIYLRKFIDITNIYIDLEHWLAYFKVLTIIIIPKPNKEFYDSLKAFWSIVLLNTINKLFKKAISKRFQFMLILYNFIYIYQLRGLK